MTDTEEIMNQNNSKKYISEANFDILKKKVEEAKNMKVSYFYNQENTQNFEEEDFLDQEFLQKDKFEDIS